MRHGSCNRKKMLNDQEIIMQQQNIELAKLNTELFALRNQQQEKKQEKKKQHEQLDRLQDDEMQVTKYQQGEGPSTSNSSRGSINKYM